MVVNMKEDNEKKLIDDIVAMLDQSVSEGIGHLNISVDKSKKDVAKFHKSVNIISSSDCVSKNMACKIPNLLEGLDDSQRKP